MNMYCADCLEYAGVILEGEIGDLQGRLDKANGRKIYAIPARSGQQGKGAIKHAVTMLDGTALCCYHSTRKQND